MALKELLEKSGLLKAGKIDTSKLTRKTIIDKRGKRTTKWVRLVKEEEDKGSIWSLIAGFFKGLAAKEVPRKEYNKHGIKDKFGISVADWTNHFLEYFKNRARWDAFFSRSKTGGGTGGGGSKGEKEKKTGGGGKGVDTKTGNKYNLSVMKFLHGLYGGLKESKDEHRQDSVDTGAGTLSQTVTNEPGSAQAEVSLAVQDAQVTDHGNESVFGGSGPGGGSRDNTGRLGVKAIKDIRAQCMEILKKADSDITAEEKEILKLYEGAGGIEKEGRGILDQFYTPQNVVNKVWELANHYKSTGKGKVKALEPAAGTGRFGFDMNVDFDMVEPDPIAARICKILNPDAKIIEGEFQQLFFKDGRIHQQEYKGDKYDVVIGNPPYRPYEGKWKGMGEGKGHTQMHEYFIDRGLDTLKEGGVLAMVVPSGFLRNQNSKVKEEIAKKGRLVAAYRLPNGTFSTTGVGTDIIIIRKEKNENPEWLFDDNYFKDNSENILGVESTRTGPYGPERYVALKEGQTFDDVINAIKLTETVQMGERTLSEEAKRNISLALMGNDNAKKLIHAEDKANYKMSHEDDTVEQLEAALEAEKGDTIVDMAKVEALQELLDEATKKTKYNDVSTYNLKKFYKQLNNKISSGEATEEAQGNLREMEVELRKRKEWSGEDEKKAKQRERIIKESEKSKEAISEIINKSRETHSLEEFVAKYGKQFNEADIRIWKHTKADTSLDMGFIPWNKEYQQKVCYLDGKFYHNANYASGKISEKLAQLEKEKDVIIEKYGEDQYKRQKELLEKTKPPKKTTKEITLSPISSFARDFVFDSTKDEEGNGGRSLLDVFWDWCGVDSNWRGTQYNGGATPHDLTGGIEWNDIVEYVNREPRKKGRHEDKEFVDQVRAKRRDNAERLFNRFVQEGLGGELKEEFERKFNDRFNDNVDPDPSQIPVFVSGLSKTFKGKELVVKDIQLEGVARLCNKGSGLLAYEVGVGKTLTGILSTVQQIQLGRAKKPVIMVPKSTYKNWLREIRDLFPDLKVNDLGNLRGFNKDNMPDIEDGSLSVVTYQALDNATFKDDTLIGLSQDIQDVMANPFNIDLKKRESESEKERLQTMAGKGAKVKDDVIFFEDLGFDHVTCDEAHNFKNVFGRADMEEEGGGRGKVSNEYSTVTGSTSARAAKMFMLTQHIQKINDGRNVFLLTATPFTNSPLEIYNMLSLMARDRLKDMGLYNVNEFLSAFARVQDEWAVSHTGQIVKKGVIKEFHNVGALQKLIKEYIDFKGIDDINKKAGYEAIKRPKKYEHMVELPNNPVLAQILEGEAKRMMDHEEMKKGGVLKGIGNSRSATLSPALVAHKLDKFHGDVQDQTFRLVEDSPKLSFSCGLTAEIYKNRPDLGHILYMPEGVEKYNDVVTYMTQNGIPKDAIATISGSMSGEAGAEKIEAIMKDFNDPDGKIKVVIGSKTIMEGVNLNGNTAFLHNLMLGWNASETVQLEGRAWRQGNRQENVHVITPCIHDSIDSVMYQKHDEKKSRFAEIHNFNGDKMDAGEIDPKEVKFDLIKDPRKKAEFRIQLETEKLNDQKLEKRIIRDGITNIKKQITANEMEIPRLQEEIAQHDKNMEAHTLKMDEIKADIKAMPKETEDELKAIKRKEDYELDWERDRYNREKGWRDSKRKKIDRINESTSTLSRKLAEMGSANAEEMVAKLDKEIDDINAKIKDIIERKDAYIDEERKNLESRKKVIPGVPEQIASYAQMLLGNVQYSQESGIQKAFSLFYMNGNLFKARVVRDHGKESKRGLFKKRIKILR